MKPVRLAFIASLGLSLACLMAAFYYQGGWIYILISLTIGAPWMLLVWKGRRSYSLSFFGLLALLIYGAVVNLPTVWLLGSLVSLLAAWDLGEFSAHIVEFSHGQVSSLLVRNHLRRILWVSGAGYMLGVSALLIKIQLGFEAAVLLGLLVFVGIASSVRFLRGNL